LLNGEELIMATTREIKIGIFVTGLLLLLALAIIFIGNIGDLFKKQGYEVYALFDSALGLENKASVKLAGIKIGEVKDITLAGRRAKVGMMIYPQYQIPRGSRATLSSLGILGEKYVEIIPGREEAFYQSGEVMDSLPPISFDQLGTLFMSMGEDLKKISSSVSKIITPELGKNISQTIEHLAKLSAELDSLVQENKASLHQTLTGSARTVDNLNLQIEAISGDIKKTLHEIQSLVGDNKAAVQENLEKLKEDLATLGKTLNNLNETLEKVNKGEGTVGGLVNDPSLYEETKSTLQEVKKITSGFSSLRAGGGLEGSYYGESELFKGSLYGSLTWQNRAFLSAGVINDPFRDKFVYSLQGGYKTGPLALRAGLIESYFGAGMDLYLFKDKLNIGAEGFNFNREPRPQFRVFGRLYPVKNVYLVVGLDDFTLAERREFYFGLGFEFK
jgi:phospholipid/cholesterol/gamma-HCH transport system substrate-binding protein